MEIQEGFVTTGLSTVEGGSPDTTADVSGDDVNGQGASDEGQQAGSETETTYGGFKTVDELIADHQAKAKEVEELGGLKGRLGNELGSLRAEKERLAGMLEAYKMQGNKPTNQTGADFAELEKKFNDGEITIGQLFQERDRLVQQNLEKVIKESVQGVKSEFEFEKYKDNFIKENPGYLDAYTSGKLNQWLERGFGGEQAWDKYQLETLKAEKEEIQKKITTKTEAARKDGINTGVKIEQGKGPSSKVLGSDGASFGQGKTNQPILSHKDRVAAARDILHRMRST